MATVLLPVPRLDFDPSEVAVSWKVLTQLGHRVVFATPDGGVARGDGLMLSGQGLDIWGWIPGARRIVAVGRALRADRAARAAYEEMERAAEYREPTSWAAASLEEADGLLLAGGHRARGMRSYLESPRLQELCVEAFARGVPVAAICHGALLVARSVDPSTGRSVLYGRTTTALTWQLERTAWRLARVTRFWDPTYYRTYVEAAAQPPGYMSVQAEVTRALRDPADFRDVDPLEPNARLKRSGRARDSPLDERPAFVVREGNYVSARWPGDVHTFRQALRRDAARACRPDWEPGRARRALAAAVQSREMVSSTRVFIEFCCVALLAYWPVMAFSTKRTIDTEEQLRRALECADARSRARRRNGVPAP